MLMVAEKMRADIQPFHIVEDTGIHNFVECLDPQNVLSRKNVFAKCFVELF